MFIGDREKEEIFDTVTGDMVLDYYGYLSRAKKGYNPFRNDQKPGSFHKTRRGSWIDYAENRRYDPAIMVAIEEDLDIKADYPAILEKLASIGGLSFEDRKPKDNKKYKELHAPSSSERVILGLCEESCMYICDYTEFSMVKPEYLLGFKSTKDGYMVYNAEKVKWTDLAEKCQKELDDLVRRKAYERIGENLRLIKDLDDPNSRISVMCEQTDVSPEEVKSKLKLRNTTLFSLYREYGGVSEYKTLLSKIAI